MLDTAVLARRRQHDGQVRAASPSLAQTAGWLAAPGTVEREPTREVPTDGHLVTLPGFSSGVEVVRPSGAFRATHNLSHE